MMRFVVFDLEATCWDGNVAGRTQEIIEIGAVLVDRYGETLSSYQRFIRPVQNPTLSHYCKELTNISQEQVDSAGIASEVLLNFQDWIDIEMEYVLCSWGSKDLELLLRDHHSHRLDTQWLNAYIDIKAQYYEKRSLRKWRGLKRTLEKEGLDMEGMHHRALNDAQSLAHLVVKYIDEWSY